MFGPEWLDLTVATVLAVVGLLSLARLVLTPRGGRAEPAWHTVMAAGMVAMVVPAVDPFPRWTWAVGFTVVAAWAMGVLVRLGPVYGPRGVAIGPEAWRHTTAHAVHHLAASLLMLLMVAAGHGSGPSSPRLSVAPTHPGHAAMTGGPSLFGPRMWLAGVTFLAVAVRAAVRLPLAFRASRPVHGVRHMLSSPLVSGVCSTVMPAGMGVMAVAVALA